MYSFFGNLAHKVIMFVRQIYKIKKLSPISFKVISFKREKWGLFESFYVSMVTNFDVKST